MLAWYGDPASCVHVVVQAPYDRRSRPMSCHGCVSGISLLKAEESRRLHVALYWRACSMYAPSTLSILNVTATHNTYHGGVQ